MSIVEALKDRMGEAAVWMKRKLCRHRPPWRYEEVRTGEFDRVSWSAFLCCPKCGEVIQVEASYHGNKHRLAEAIEEEL